MLVGCVGGAFGCWFNWGGGLWDGTQPPQPPRTPSVRAVSGRTLTVAAGMDARHHDYWCQSSA